MSKDLENILKQVIDLFMRYGIKSMTMDDVARSLGVSKKTLYKYVSDKSDLVEKTIKLKFEEQKKDTKAIMEEGLNAIDENFKVTQYILETLKKVHPSIHYDLEKYYPEAWKIFSKHKRDFIFSCVKDNLERGVKEGLYRNDLNIPVIATVYVHRIDLVFDGEVFPADRFDFPEVYLELFRYHIRGIASIKGIEYLEKKFEHDGI